MSEPIEIKAANAIAELVESEIVTTGWNVYATGYEGEKVTPFIFCQCQSATIDQPRNGNYMAEIVVGNTSEIGFTSSESHKTMAENIRALFVGCMDDISDMINTLAPDDFTALHWTPESVQAGVDDEGEKEHRLNILTGSLGCCPSTI